MKKFVTILAFLLVSCATTTAYAGPVSDKALLSVSYLRHVVPDVDPRLPEHLETLATASITNPSTKPMTVTLDCTVSTTTLTVAPRQTEHVLLDPKDSSCTVTR